MLFLGRHFRQPDHAGRVLPGRCSGPVRRVDIRGTVGRRDGAVLLVATTQELPGHSQVPEHCTREYLC